VGASVWDYVFPVKSSIAETLTALQQQVLDNKDFYWDLSDEDTGEDLPRPTTLEQLAEHKEREEFWEVGTHTILDLDRVVEADDEDHDGTLRPLSPDETRACFGSERPTAEDFARVYGDGTGDAINSVWARRWSGRCVVLHEGDRPTAVAFWATPATDQRRRGIRYRFPGRPVMRPGNKCSNVASRSVVKIKGA
jgi:hypothetical protein